MKNEINIDIPSTRLAFCDLEDGDDGRVPFHKVDSRFGHMVPSTGDRVTIGRAVWDVVGREMDANELGLVFILCRKFGNVRTPIREVPPPHDS